MRKLKSPMSPIKCVMCEERSEMKNDLLLVRSYLLYYTLNVGVTAVVHWSNETKERKQVFIRK